MLGFFVCVLKWAKLFFNSYENKSASERPKAHNPGRHAPPQEALGTGHVTGHVAFARGRQRQSGRSLETWKRLRVRPARALTLRVCQSHRRVSPWRAACRSCVRDVACRAVGTYWSRRSRGSRKCCCSSLTCVGRRRLSEPPSAPAEEGLRDGAELPVAVRASRNAALCVEA